MPVARLAARAAAAGLDLTAPFAVDDWNAGAAAEHRLPDFGRRALAVVIGNSRALWDAFVAALARDGDDEAEPDPLDRYVEREVAAAAAASGVAAELRFAHRPPYLPVQRMAAAAGLAALAPSHLSVHPVHGPWIAVRAVVVLDLEAPPQEFRGVSMVSDTVPAGCDCPARCLPAFQRAAAVGFDPGDETRWRAWVDVRDACPAGRAHRYAEEQIRYHYGRDRTALAAAVARWQGRCAERSPP